MKRLVALAVRSTWEGDWQTGHGNELAAVAYPVGTDEKVWLEILSSAGGVATRKKLLLSAVPTSLRDLRIDKYRVVKDSTNAKDCQPTTVELILSNGRS